MAELYLSGEIIDDDSCARYSFQPPKSEASQVERPTFAEIWLRGNRFEKAYVVGCTAAAIAIIFGPMAYGSAEIGMGLVQHHSQLIDQGKHILLAGLGLDGLLVGIEHLASRVAIDRTPEEILISINQK